MRLIELPALLLLLMAPASTPQLEQTEIDSAGQTLIDCAPQTFEAAVRCLQVNLPEEDRAQLLRPDGPVLAHMGLGMFLRNEWGLWNEESALSRALTAQGFIHPDDMSATIVEAYVAAETGRAFDLDSEIAHYREFWSRQTPETNLPRCEDLDKLYPDSTEVHSCTVDFDAQAVTNSAQALEGGPR